jgi:formate-dependent nitrite reductase membrane component NrfD
MEFFKKIVEWFKLHLLAVFYPLLTMGTKGALASKVSELSGVVMAAVLAFIFTGLGVYVVSEMGTQANISVLSTLATNLGTWGTTWFPIILIVVAASVIIGLLIRGFGGR